LFVVVADHGHRLPRSTSWAYSPGKYHIPLLFYGDVIKPEYRGQKVTKLGNQTDMAATLLGQLGLPHEDFKWSKNLLNPHSKEFAFYDWDNGFGFMLPRQAVAYDSQGKRVIYRKNPDADEKLTEEALKNGKAFMQQIYTEYLAY
jgi:arylsulfatase A-like enzyme